MLIYDPSNKKEFSDGYFDDGSGISFRYLNSKFGLSKYLPYGPNISSEKNISDVCEKLNSLKFLKLKIDLPFIYDEATISKVKQTLIVHGFKQSDYLIDNQTILINRDNFNIEKKDRYYVRKSESAFQFEFSNAISAKDIDEIYKLYQSSAIRQKYIAKNKKVFELHLKNSFSVIARSENQIHGFILGENVRIGGENSRNVLYNLYTGATEVGLKTFVGYGMYNFWLTNAFEKGIDIVNMYGAKTGSDYSTFKRKYVYKSEESATVELPGSFEKYSFKIL